ncbi:MAG: DUF4465 domain-containing protein [Bacteroidales bacterium]|nr:DUF4465 domain-containing protein [Bacteroidales bacterium]
MKQIYNFMITSLLLLVIFFNSTSQSFGNNNEIPDDWKNDLWLNTNYREMTVGDNYNIVARRVPEIIDNPISNSVTLPTFHYNLIKGNSISVSATGLISAENIGTSIIEVTYDEKEANGKTYGAVSLVNKTYMIVDVIDETVNTGITLTTDISTRSYDTHYFLGDDLDFSFLVTTEGADNISVKCNDIDAINTNNSYTSKLQNRANIIEIIASNSIGTKKLYYVIDARKIEINTKNISKPNEVLEKGDKAQISFKGITIPVYKLATIYNPQYASMWGGDFTRVYYNNATLGEVKTNVNVTQYDIADNNSIEITFNEAGNYTFTDGHIHELWWGSALGSEKDMSGPGEPNLNAPTNESDFSFLPDFEINVEEVLVPATFEDIALDAESHLVADVSTAGLYESVTQTNTSGSFDFKNTVTNWGSMTSWTGVAVSNRTDNTNPGDVANQFNSAAGGDIDGDGNYSVIYDSNSGGMNMGPDYTISFKLADFPNGRTVSGCYIANSTYGTTSMKESDGFAKKFGGADGNDPDWFKITAEGISKEGNSTGSIDFYLADFRFEDNAKDYILENWKWFDLSSLGNVIKVQFTMSSSDAGQYGMNTPSYFCLDNLHKQRLKINTQLEDIEREINSSDDIIDLTNLFSDPENSNIEKSIIYNSNSELVNTIVNDDNLTLSYTSGKSGIAEIIVQGISGKMSVSDTFTVIINRDESLFVANPIADINIDEDSPLSEVNIENVFSDINDDDNLIQKSIISTINENLVVFTLENNIISITPKANQSGETKIIIEAISNGTSLTDTFNITVTPADDAPFVANNISDITVNEDKTIASIDISNIFDDIDNDNTTITKTVKNISTNSLLTASISENKLVIELIGNQFGESEIVIEATSNGLSINDTLTVTVNPVDDAPTVINPFSDITANEDETIASIDISNVFDDIDNDNTAIRKVVKNISNNSLLTANISENSLEINLIENQTGESELIIEATSNGLTITDTLTIHINPVNDAPTVIETLEDVNVDMNSENQEIDLSNIFEDIDGDDLEITVSNNTNEDVVQTTISSNILTLGFIQDQYGSTEITLMANDGSETISTSFNINVKQTTGIDSPDKLIVKVYPNPVQDVLYINYEFGIKRVIVYNSIGNIQKIVNPDNNINCKVMVSDLPAGTYFICIEGENNKTTRTIIKQ